MALNPRITMEEIMNKRLHSVVALFDSPDQIIHAAEKTCESGYKDFDVHTPYPLHGMDQAMRLPGTKLPYVSLVFGLLGLFFATFMQWFTMGNPLHGFGVTALGLPQWLERYPFVIGGKPLFSLPAFIPVMFELTVLFCALATVAFLIAWFCGLPNNSHPLHDTDYMKGVSGSRFGLCIEAIDAKFEEQDVHQFMEGLGGQDITSVRQVYKRPPSYLSSFLFFWVLVLVILAASGKFYFVFNRILYYPPFTWMETQSKVNAQATSLNYEDGTPIFANGLAMQAPVAGTVSRGNTPYLFAKNPEQAAQMVINPLQTTAEHLGRGKDLFEVYCGICHGDFGDGDGSVSRRTAAMALKPPSLHSRKLKEFSDGRLYHIISNGQNVMPGYAKQIQEKDRWTIIQYIRALQRARDAKEGDLL
jgi:mono/diheme cytochrome c family protein